MFSFWSKPTTDLQNDRLQASKKLCKILLSEHASDSAQVILTFEPASLTDVFDSVKLTMSTHIPAEDHVSNHDVPGIHALLGQSEPEASSTSLRKLQQSDFNLASALKSVQSTVQTLGSAVDDAVAAANIAAALFSSGNYQSTNTTTTELVDFNVNNVTHVGPQCQFAFDKSFTKTANSTVGSSGSSHDADITGTCENCYAHVGATITLAIDISGGSLQSASVIMSGDAKIQATLDMTIDGQYNYTKQKLIRSLQTPSLTFFLAGVPIRMSIGTPVYLGFDATVSGALHLTADMAMSATMKSGFTYTGGDTHFINDLSFSESGSGVNLVKVDDVSATVRFFLLPIPALNVDYMGGPTVGLKTYVEAVVDNAQTASQTCSTGPSVVTNAGLDGTIGADIHIGLAGKNLYSKKYDSVSTFSLHHILKKAFCPGSSSSSTASSGRRLQQSSSGLGAWSQIGNVWQGAQVYTGAGSRCSQSDYPAYVSISLQLVDVINTGSGPIVDLLATINRGDSSATSNSFTQLNQQLYTVSAYSGGATSFTATDDPVNYQGTQSGSPLNLQPQYGTFNWEGAGDLISLQDTLNCVQTNLKLVAASNGNTPSAANSTALSTTCPWMAASSATISSASSGILIWFMVLLDFHPDLKLPAGNACSHYFVETNSTKLFTVLRDNVQWACTNSRLANSSSTQGSPLEGVKLLS